MAPFCIHTISYGAEYRRRYWGLEFRTTDAELGPVYRHVVASFVLD